MKARLRTRRQHANGAISTGVIRPRTYGVTVTAEFDGLLFGAPHPRFRVLVLPQPILLFLGDVAEPGFAKTAFGLRDWAGDRCVGEYALPGARVRCWGCPSLDHVRRGSRRTAW